MLKLTLMKPALFLQEPIDTLPTAFWVGYGIFVGAIVILIIVSQWKIYLKAGYGGWECIVPIYNIIILLKIVGKPWWWIFLLLLFPLTYIWLIWMTNMLSKSFGKDEGFTVGLLLLGIVFYPILAFGKAEYQGPYGNKEAYEAYQAAKRPSFDFENKI
jgi:hypothetical protein